jgi:hypothetical protein
LEKCPRAYFYQYYAARFSPPKREQQAQLFFDGAPRHAFIAADDVALAAKLMPLVSAPQHAGTVLHSLIAHSLKNPDWASEWFLRNAEKRFDHLPDGVGFVERSNGLADAEDKIQASRQSMLNALHTFFDNDDIRQLAQDLTGGEESLIERPLSGFESIRGFSITGRVDVTSRRESQIDIVDWKMGKSQGDEDSLQMGLYGVWASRRFEVRPQYVRVRRVFLGDAHIEEAKRLNSRAVTRVMARLSQDIEAIEVLHPYGAAGNAVAFSPKPKEKVCALCKFRALCPAVACMIQ